MNLHTEPYSTFPPINKYHSSICWIGYLLITALKCHLYLNLQHFIFLDFLFCLLEYFSLIPVSYSLIIPLQNVLLDSSAR